METPDDGGRKSCSGSAGRLLPLASALVFVICMALGGLGYFSLMPPERTCVSCHEIRPSYEQWTRSAHREVSCKACHGGSADSVHALRENVKRVFSHLTKSRHDDIRLSEEQTLRMTQACQRCHASEYAGWSRSGHGTNYAAIFMDERHNQKEKPAGQCLLCHGMFFEGGVENLMEPLDLKGPWRFKNPAMASRAVIPCSACHQMHAPGASFRRGIVGGAQETNQPAFRWGALAFYSRTEKAHIPAEDLPVLQVTDGSKLLRMSQDPRQRLCMQCHTPDAFGHAGTGDDRTPRGPYEGMSCLACHAPHSNDTRAFLMSQEEGKRTKDEADRNASEKRCRAAFP